MASVLLVLAGIAVVLAQLGSLAAGNSVLDNAAAASFLTAGVAGVVAGLAVWLRRASWGSAALVVWIGGTIIGFILGEPPPLGAGVLMPIALVAGPQALITWYLTHWLRHGTREVAALRQEEAPLGAVATGVFLLVSVLAPPLIALAAFMLMTVIPGDFRVAPIVALPTLLCAFIVGLSRRAAPVRPRIVFVLAASGSSIISLFVVFTASIG